VSEFYQSIDTLDHHLLPILLQSHVAELPGDLQECWNLWIIKLQISNMFILNQSSPGENVLKKNLTPQDDCRNLLRSEKSSTLTIKFTSPRIPCIVS